MSPSQQSRTRWRGLTQSSRRLLVTTLATGLAWMAVQAPVAGAATSAWTPTPDVGIVPFAGDVFTVESAGILIPVDPRSTDPSAPLFNDSGIPLGMTWQQWRSATATSYAWPITYRGTTYTVFLISMSGLIPGGVYSVFYRTFAPDSNNPFCPNTEPTVGLTAAFPQFQKPDPESFTASNNGKAWFLASVPGDLLAAQRLQVFVVYHFDGKTYGSVPNHAESLGPDASNGGLCHSSYGSDAMRQFLIIQKSA